MMEITTEQAKEFLEKQGYFTETLWSVNDVKGKFNCTDEQAQKVLSSVFNGEWLTGEIFEAIQITGESMNLQEASEQE